MWSNFRNRYLLLQHAQIAAEVLHDFPLCGSCLAQSIAEVKPGPGSGLRLNLLLAADLVDCHYVIVIKGVHHAFEPTGVQANIIICVDDDMVSRRR